MVLSMKTNGIWTKYVSMSQTCVRPYFTVLIVMYRDRALGCKPFWTSIVESGDTFVFISFFIIFIIVS